MSSGTYSIHSKSNPTSNICELCGKPKSKNEKSLWIHRECFELLRDFIIKNHGLNAGMWSYEFRKGYVKEYLRKNPMRERVQFT